jgi:hypothetical protein
MHPGDFQPQSNLNDHQNNQDEFTSEVLLYMIPVNTLTLYIPPSFLTFFFLKKWGGISSEEHDEAVMLEAAMFGGVPEGPTYPFPMPSHRSSTHYPPIVHSPPPELTEQRLLREQQV